MPVAPAFSVQFGCRAASDESDDDDDDMRDGRGTAAEPATMTCRPAAAAAVRMTDMRAHTHLCGRSPPQKKHHAILIRATGLPPVGRVLQTDRVE